MLALAACGHPGVPSSALRAAPTFTAQPEAAQSPMLAVDLYAPANYPAAVVRADGTRTLAYIKNVLHANTVGIVWDYFSASDTSSTVQRTRKTLTPRNVAILTRIARADGLRVEYRPLIFVPSAPNPWEGLILPANPLQWFASYYQAELPYLKVAQRLHVREFVLATEMHVLNGSHLWPLLFSRAASVYHGTVSYAAWEGIISRLALMCCRSSTSAWTCTRNCMSRRTPRWPR